MEDKREKLDRIWDSVGAQSIEYLDQNFNEIAPALVEFLIVSLLEQETFEIGIHSSKKDSEAIISYNIYDSDKELTLNYTSKSQFKLRLSLRDFDDEEKTYEYLLSDNEIMIIPPGLVNLIKETKESQKARTVRSGSLTE